MHLFLTWPGWREAGQPGPPASGLHFNPRLLWRQACTCSNVGLEHPMAGVETDKGVHSHAVLARHPLSWWLIYLQFLSPWDKAWQTFIFWGPYMGVSSQNWRCGEKTGRPPRADGSCRSKALPVPRPLARLPLIVEARTQSESIYPAHIWTFSFLATVMLLPQKGFLKFLPSTLLESTQACPALSLPSLLVLPVIPT